LSAYEAAAQSAKSAQGSNASSTAPAGASATPGAVPAASASTPVSGAATTGATTATAAPATKPSLPCPLPRPLPLAPGTQVVVVDKKEHYHSRAIPSVPPSLLPLLTWPKRLHSRPTLQAPGVPSAAARQILFRRAATSVSAETHELLNQLETGVPEHAIAALRQLSAATASSRSQVVVADYPGAPM